MIVNGPNSYSLERKCFVKFNETHIVKNLRVGNYKLSIKHGTDWKQPFDTNLCSGEFTRNRSYTGVTCSKIFKVEKHNNNIYTTTNTQKSEFDKENRKRVCINRI